MINYVNPTRKNCDNTCWCGEQARWVVNYTCHNGKERDYYFCTEHIKQLEFDKDKLFAEKSKTALIS